VSITCLAESHDQRYALSAQDMLLTDSRDLPSMSAGHGTCCQFSRGTYYAHHQGMEKVCGEVDLGLVKTGSCKSEVDGTYAPGNRQCTVENVLATNIL